MKRLWPWVAIGVVFILVLVTRPHSAQHRHLQQASTSASPAAPPQATTGTINGQTPTSTNANATDNIPTTAAVPTTTTNALQSITSAAAAYLLYRENNPGGADAAFLKQNSWHIVVKTQCDFDIEAAQPTTTSAILKCSVVDTTVDRQNLPVAETFLPNLWVLNGSQQPAYLVMALQGSRWAVVADKTGQAQ